MNIRFPVLPKDGPFHFNPAAFGPAMGDLTVKLNRFLGMGLPIGMGGALIAKSEDLAVPAVGVGLVGLRTHFGIEGPNSLQERTRHEIVTRFLQIDTKQEFPIGIDCE